MLTKIANQKKRYMKLYRETNKESIAKQTHLWAVNNKERKRINQFHATLRKYELTEDKYDFLCSKGYEICGSFRHLHIDHDHETGKFRGILCAACNTGLGKLGDNLEGLLKALNYLSRKRLA